MANRASNTFVLSLFPGARQDGKLVNFHPENFHINSVEQLLFAEEVLDAMDAELVDKVHYATLHAKAQAYISKNLELLHKPWLRAAGAVHDIIESLRQQQGVDAPASVPAHCH